MSRLKSKVGMDLCCKIRKGCSTFGCWASSSHLVWFTRARLWSASKCNDHVTMAWVTCLWTEAVGSCISVAILWSVGFLFYLFLFCQLFFLVLSSHLHPTCVWFFYVSVLVSSAYVVIGCSIWVVLKKYWSLSICLKQFIK